MYICSRIEFERIIIECGATFIYIKKEHFRHATIAVVCVTSDTIFILYRKILNYGEKIKKLVDYT